MNKFAKPGSSPSGSAAVEYLPQDGPSPLSHLQHELLSLDGVEGVGAGTDPSGQEAIMVYVRDDAVLDKLPSELEGKSILPMVTGVIRAE